MPPLRRSKRDGHYYIRQGFGGPIATYQVSSDGVRWLANQYIEEDDEVSPSLLKRLRALGYATTGHSGVDWSVSNPIAEPNKDDHTADSKAPTLMCREQEESPGWQLAIAIAELPRGMAGPTGAAGPDRLLAEGRLVVAGREVPATTIRPGGGGLRCPVPAQKEVYKIEPRGSWTLLWQHINTWRDLPGLTPTGTLFMGIATGGRRIQQGESLIRGRAYYLVRSRLYPRPLPTGLKEHLLGRRGDWEALRIQIPTVPDTLVGDWCIQQGHRLTEPPWRIQLLTPPHGYLPDGIPIVGRGLILLSLTPPQIGTGEPPPRSIVVTQEEFNLAESLVLPQAGVRIANNPQHLSIAVADPGRYRVHVPSGNVEPVAFVVATDSYQANGQLWTQPVPLMVSLKGVQATYIWSAFSAEPSEPFVTTAEQMPEWTVRCPVPFTLSWRDEAGKPVRSVMLANEVAASLTLNLMRRLAAGKDCHVRVDGGAFGTVLVSLTPPASSGIAVPLAPPLLRQARSLARLIGAAGAELPRVAVAVRLQQRLQVFEDDPMARPLAHIQWVPSHLLTALAALAVRVPEKTQPMGEHHRVRS